MRVSIYHNPKCSKSRETLALLRNRGVEPLIVEYLKAPPTAAELMAVVGKLGIQPDRLVPAKARKSTRRSMPARR